MKIKIMKYKIMILYFTIHKLKIKNYEIINYKYTL